jgi:hypothetical protein
VLPAPQFLSSVVRADLLPRLGAGFGWPLFSSGSGQKQETPLAGGVRMTGKVRGIFG